MQQRTHRLASLSQLEQLAETLSMLAQFERPQRETHTTQQQNRAEKKLKFAN